MPNKVFEGVAELDIQSFLQNLDKMEQAVQGSAAKLSAGFQSLDQSVQQALAGVNGHIKAVAQQISGIGQALAQANGQVKQGQAALQQQASQANAQARQNQQNAAQVRQLELASLQADYARQQAIRRQAMEDASREAADARRRDLAALRAGGELEAKQIQAKYAQERTLLERQITDLRKFQNDKLKLAADLRRDQLDLNKAGFPNLGKVAEEEYHKVVMAARAAEEEQANLAKQLTAAMEMEAKAQTAAVSKSVKDQADAHAQNNRAYLNGWRAAVGQAVADAAEGIKKVEEKWNSLFRAGSQISGVGQRLSLFGGALGAMGLKLSENAGDFDFWTRRIVAAAKSAGSSIADITSSKPQVAVRAFSEQVLQLGRDLGTLKPDEVAQSWYLYQAAVGTAINSNEDLMRSQSAIDSILKAAVVSDTNYETAIRGVTQAMAEFGMGQDEAAHATAVMLNLTQTSQAEFSDVLESFKMVGPQAHLLGVSLEDVSAIMARLSDYGLRGSRAGTALQQVMTTLLDPTDKASDALQYLLVKSQNLTGAWQEQVFKGGEFIGLLDRLNEKGDTVSKGFLHLVADATKGMNEAQRQSMLAAIFSQNAFRNMVPLINEYTKSMNDGSAATTDGKKRMEEMALEFRNVEKQANLFNDQWSLVADSIKVKLGQALFGMRESLTRLGLVVAEIFIPIIAWINRALQAFIAWADEHPKLARAIIGLVAGVGVLATILGPLLIIIGQVMQGFAAWKIIAETLAQSTNVLAVATRGLGATMLGLAGPVAVVLAILGALYLAWKTNFLGMGEILGQFFGSLTAEFAAIGDLLEGVFALIGGILSGNTEQIREALNSLGSAFVEAFYVLPQRIGEALEGVTEVLVSWAADTLGGLLESLFVWGYNLMASLASGIYEGAAAFVEEAVSYVAEMVAGYFRSYSPPKIGPLRGIYDWGRNLIGTFIEGMNASDLGAIEDITSRIGDALKRAIQSGDTEANVYAATMGQANEMIAQMLQTVKDGGRVTAEFFEPLRDGLGEWYDEVVNIALAYQDVYALQNSIALEKEKLELIRQQRKELDAQNEARMDAFDRELGLGGDEDFQAAEQSGEMIDPTTPEGKAAIARMRQQLSQEEFQNWLNWQRRMWEAKHKAEDQALQQQENSQDAVLEALSKQLEAVQAQYDLYEKMFEYAQRMADLAEEQKKLEEEKDKQAKDKVLTTGTPADLSAARSEIAGVVGADTALQDESGLIEKNQGDVIAAIGDAGEARETEENRLSELEKLNRKKRAEFETALINATSDEERNRIKQQKDAWDAAYKEEKARLQERIGFTKEVAAALEEAADKTKAEREASQEQAYQAEIKKLLGEQTGQIEDANQLKSESKDLDEAQVKAQNQMRDEERKLQDLRDLGQEKKLEFEDRLRAAAGDDEATRKIKEEQEAWETAYKRALQTQEARVEAARRAKQDLADQETAINSDKEKKGPKAPKGFEPAPIPGGGGGDLIDKIKNVEPPPWLQPGYEPPWMKKPKDDSGPRDSQKEANQVFANVKRALGFLGDEAVPTAKKLELLWGATKEFSANFVKKLWDVMTLIPRAIGLDKVVAWLVQKAVEGFNWFIARIQGAWGSVVAWWGTVQAGWNLLWTTLGAAWTTFKTNLTNGWNLFWSSLKGAWDGFLAWITPGWNAFWKTLVDVFAFFVGLGYVIWLTFKEWWIGFWNGITAWWKTNVSEPFTKWWNEFWTGLTKWWQENVSTPFTKWWSEFWTGLTTWWDENVKQPFTKAWDEFWTSAKAKWDAFKKDVSEAWDKFWKDAKASWDTFKKDVGEAWGQFWTELKTAWETFKKPFEEAWGQLWASFKADWEAVKKWWDENVPGMWDAFKKKFDEVMKPVIDGWNDLTGKVAGVFSSISSFFSNLETTVNRLIAIGRRLTSIIPGSGGGDEPDGSNANGLPFVPFDGYISELHKGERVLTAAEAAVYNRMEAMGVMGGLSALADAATSRAAQAVSPAANGVTNVVTNNGGATKSSTVNIGNVNVDSRDRERSLVQSLTHLSG